MTRVEAHWREAGTSRTQSTGSESVESKARRPHPLRRVPTAFTEAEVEAGAQVGVAEGEPPAITVFMVVGAAAGVAVMAALQERMAFTVAAVAVATVVATAVVRMDSMAAGAAAMAGGEGGRGETTGRTGFTAASPSTGRRGFSAPLRWRVLGWIIAHTRVSRVWSSRRRRPRQSITANTARMCRMGIEGATMFVAAASVEVEAAVVVVRVRSDERTVPKGSSYYRWACRRHREALYRYSSREDGPLNGNSE